MAYVITEPCIDRKDASCVDVCPVDCIYTSENGPQFFIDPDTCIDCAACESVCPVNAIYYEEDVPAEWKSYIAMNRSFFRDVPPAERTFRPRTQRAGGL